MTTYFINNPHYAQYSRVRLRVLLRVLLPAKDCTTHDCVGVESEHAFQNNNIAVSTGSATPCSVNTHL